MCPVKSVKSHNKFQKIIQLIQTYTNDINFQEDRLIKLQQTYFLTKYFTPEVLLSKDDPPWWVNLGWLPNVHQAAISLPLFNRRRRENKMKKLVD